jgi:hypothetical protein
MTIYEPDFTIEINGQNFTNTVLQGGTITAGRNDIFSETLSSYCNIELLVLDNTLQAIDLKDLLTIKVKDTNNVDVPLFTGEVSSIERRLDGGNVGEAITVNVQAVGLLATLNRSLAGFGIYPEEFDGERIRRILEQALFLQWEDIPNTIEWNELETNLTWEQYGIQGIDIIDNGRFEVLERLDEPANALDLANITASSGLGYLYETGDGLIGYSDAERRTNVFGTQQIELDAGIISIDSFATRQDTNDLINRLFISYGDPQDIVLAINDDSVEDYGIIEERIETILSQQADAEEQALRYVTLRGEPIESLDELGLTLIDPRLEDESRNTLLRVNMDTLVKVVNLPAGLISETELEGYVEGWTWTLGLNSLEIEMQVSNSIFSAFEVQWEDYSPLIEWQNLPDTLQWQDLAIG